MTMNRKRRRREKYLLRSHGGAVPRATKTVTRRLGWETLKPGTLLCGVRKAMGLKPGEKIVRLGVIRVVSVRREPLSAMLMFHPENGRYGWSEVVREGFPNLTPVEFVEMFKSHMQCLADDTVTRIEFQYVGEASL
jgi:hypothetical protein